MSIRFNSDVPHVCLQDYSDVPHVCLEVKALESLDGSNASANQNYYVTVQVGGVQSGTIELFNRSLRLQSDITLMHWT